MKKIELTEHQLKRIFKEFLGVNLSRCDHCKYFGYYTCLAPSDIDCFEEGKLADKYIKLLNDILNEE